MTITFTFASLKSQFEEALSISPNPKLLIQREIDEVLEYVNTVPNLRELRRRKKPAYQHKFNSVYFIEITPLSRELFSHAFNENLFPATKLGIRKVHSESDEVFEHRKKIYKLGNEFFKYYKWLDELNSKPVKKAKQTISLNHQEKLLALLYLGMDTKKVDNTKAAEILSAVLDMGYQNTRDFLGCLYTDAINNPVRSKKHFDNLYESFKTAGLNDIAEKIKLDAQSLKK